MPFLKMCFWQKVLPHALFSFRSLGHSPKDVYSMAMFQFSWLFFLLLWHSLLTADTLPPVGASLVVMLATEMRAFFRPEKVIIIASAKARQELPGRYRFQKKLPLYRLFPGKISKWGALRLQPIFEPDRNKEKEIFVQMLKDKDPRFLQRTIKMIIQWERTTYHEEIIHIHGEKDHTIPIKNVDYDYRIEKGSHVMTLTRAAEISRLLNTLLED